jgi:HPr kinase/phosphorylase
MEIRGIGLLYIPDLYGPESVRDESSVDLLCRLEAWRDSVEYERIGIERPRETIAGVSIPCLVLPVRPARNMATLVEVAVRDHLRRMAGSNAAERLDSRLRGEHARQ